MKNVKWKDQLIEQFGIVEEEEVVVEEESQVQDASSQELSEEELAEIMAYLETSTDVE